LITGLQHANVREAAFFAVSANLNSEGQTRLAAYANAGHIIANHTHNHPNFNQTDASDFVRNFKLADSLLSKIPNFEKWFRFPFLREGRRPEDRDTMRQALHEMGYKNAYITINNYDWYMDDQFQKEVKANSRLDLTKLKSYHVNTLIQAVEYYDDMANKHLRRSPKHVILLHETDLNAMFIADFVAELKKKEWKVISPREAYLDDIANYVTTNSFRFNPGRVGEIASDNGQKQGLWHQTCDKGYLDRKFQEQVLGLPVKTSNKKSRR
jgi:hypothetical protein